MNFSNQPKSIRHAKICIRKGAGFHPTFVEYITILKISPLWKQINLVKKAGLQKELKI